jgi:hypothetical protein
MKWEVSGSRIRGKNIDGVVNITLCEEPCLSHLTDYSILTEGERFFRILSKIRLPVCVSTGEEKRTENSSQKEKKA